MATLENPVIKVDDGKTHNVDFDISQQTLVSWYPHEMTLTEYTPFYFVLCTNTYILTTKFSDWVTAKHPTWIGARSPLGERFSSLWRWSETHTWQSHNRSTKQHNTWVCPQTYCCTLQIHEIWHIGTPLFIRLVFCPSRKYYSHLKSWWYQWLRMGAARPQRWS